MEGSELARLGYLLLLGLAVGGWLMAEPRQSMGKFLRHTAVWCFIFMGVLAGTGLWNNLQNQPVSRQLVFIEETPVIETPRAFDGHYYLTVHVNRVPVNFVIDTGATDVVLTRKDARRLGVDLDTLEFNGSAGTANGRVQTARMRVEELALGPIVDREVPVLINAGDMQTSLLGMSYLQKFSRLEISDGKLILER